MVSTKKENRKLAYNYAKAILAIAREHNLKKLFQSHIIILIDILNYYEDIRHILSSPAIDINAKKSIVKILSDNIQLHELLTNFLLIIIKNKRSEMMLDFLIEARNLILEDSGSETVELITMCELDDSILKKINQMLEEKLSFAINLVHIIDKNIIGGVIIKIKSDMYDASLKNKLELVEKFSKQRVAALSGV